MREIKFRYSALSQTPINNQRPADPACGSAGCERFEYVHTAIEKTRKIFTDWGDNFRERFDGDS